MITNFYVQSYSVEFAVSLKASTISGIDSKVSFSLSSNYDCIHLFFE